MLEREVIKTSASPWSPFIVLVKKKDGTSRFCIDYMKINGVTVKDSLLISRIDTSLDYCVVWSKIVLRFFNPAGMVTGKFGKFGVCNAGAIIEKLLERVLLNPSWKV